MNLKGKLLVPLKEFDGVLDGEFDGELDGDFNGEFDSELDGEWDGEFDGVGLGAANSAAPHVFAVTAATRRRKDMLRVTEGIECLPDGQYPR